MITAGIDIGHQSVNTVILDENRIISHDTLIIAGEVQRAAKTSFDKILDQAGMRRGDIDRLFATGIGRENVAFADGHNTEMLSHCKGAHRLFPEARTVIDVGAEGVTPEVAGELSISGDFQGIDDFGALGFQILDGFFK